MLVLSRKVGEQIVIPPCQLTMTVLEIQSDKVRLGIAAPREVPVLREEVWLEHHRAEDHCVAAAPTPVRVLIADADVHLAASYREYLEQHGFQVATAADGVECLSQLREEVPAVLVMEPGLPWGGGDGVLEVARDEPRLRQVPVIVLTHGRDRRALYQLARFGAADYLVKPLPPKRLAERISAVVARRSEGAKGGQL